MDVAKSGNSARQRSRSGCGTIPNEIECLDGPTQVRNHDGSAHHQADRQRLEEFGFRDAFLHAPVDVVRDAVVAAEDEGGHEAEQLLGATGQRTVVVDAVVESEEPPDVEVLDREDALVETLAEGAKLVNAVGHGGRLHRVPSKGQGLPCRSGTAARRAGTSAGMDAAALADRLRREAQALGAVAVGITTADELSEAEVYRAWVGWGFGAGMAYLARPDAVARRLSPRAAWPPARSVLVAAWPYALPERAAAGHAGARVARYAESEDYHDWVKQRLATLAQRLHAWAPEVETRIYVDTGPLLERALARRAGLGWIGRNTLLLVPGVGSYVVLGFLLLSIELPPDAPYTHDGCATCTQCLEACPTGALLGRDATGAPWMDARRCIAYWTIEHRGPLPPAIRPLLGTWVFGCDVCQEVCPPNRKPRRRVALPEDVRARPLHGAELQSLLRLSDEDFRARFRRTPLWRARRAGLLRNVAVALGNLGDTSAIPALALALWDPEPLVRGHAAWALGRLGTRAARQALEGRQECENDPWVRHEIVAALTALGAANERSS